ncbi:MAG: helix-turn-helix transcriptional regulator, partial [Paracoccaceae bacterium]
MEFSASLGKRIKDKRQSIGVKQKELAKRVGISPSYLNLIESNQRRIGGKLVLLMAEALSVDPSYLSRGAEQVKISQLEEIARLNINNYSDITMPAAEFASKFPSWVDLLISLDRKAKSLEALIETLNDRVAHDPHLAASLHEVLTTISAIKSASEILKDEPNLESKWQHKFNQNIFEDSNRLAEGAQLLVNYL